jgi:uncharacterized protein (DUF488 family)
MEFYTLGVYGLSEEEFFKTLIFNNIDTFVDIRRRRAVRGAKYSFVNSKQLQKKLHEIGIKYIHILELAPTNEIRDLQKEADKNSGVLKRERNELGEVFTNEYQKKILDKFDITKLTTALVNLNTNRALLFCVEKEAKACHRSLVAKKLETEFSYKINHL